MLTEEQVDASCPYCGEPIQLLIDWSIEQQEYIEDCQVCCRPIIIQCSIADGAEPNVFLRTESD